MPQFQGTLNPNEAYASLYNMIISHTVDADDINGTYGELVDLARVDGGLFGDKKLITSTDALGSREWGGDSEATNLLAINRAPAPKTQEIVLNRFRQIDVTTDEYLTKRAWMSEGAFLQFNSRVTGWLTDTKRIYDSTYYNAHFGTFESNVGAQEQEVKISEAIILTPAQGTPGSEGYVPAVLATGEEKNRLTGAAIAEHMANLIVDLKDVTRKFNDYGFIRSYSIDGVKVVWSSKWINKILKFDLPTLFHKEGLIDKFEQHVLPSRFFGHELDATLAAASVYNADTNPKGMFTKSGNKYTIVNTGGTAHLVHTLEEMEFTLSGTKYHLFPGDIIPVGYELEIDSDTVNVAYIEDEDIICKVVTELPPYMSSFEVGTAFMNPRSLTKNNYLTWGFNTLEYLSGKPMITVYAD